MATFLYIFFFIYSYQTCDLQKTSFSGFAWYLLKHKSFNFKFNFDDIQCIYFIYFAYIFGVISKKLLPNLGCEDLCLSKNLILLTQV